MSKLTTTQTNAIAAYEAFLKAGTSYGDAMREAAKALGDTPCITLLNELAKVHAAKYGCSYTWSATGTAVFCRPRITANSRSMAWAEGSSLATGPGLARMT